jgi:hypothetical protein
MTPAEVTSRLAVAQLELMAKGHTPKDSETATWRAVRYAERMSSLVRPAVRGAVFEDLLANQLAGCESWISGVEEARARGDYAAGVERAARDDRYAAAMERLTGVRPQQTAQAWLDSQATAVEAWETGR